MKILLEVEVKVNGDKCLRDCRYLAMGGGVPCLQHI